MNTKTLSIFTILLFAVLTCSAQIGGSWKGVLDINGFQLRVVFNINDSNGVYRSTMDSPDQGAKDIQVTNTIYKNDSLTLEIKRLKIGFKGKLEADHIEGVFRQNGLELPLVLKRGNLAVADHRKVQEPVKPYTYISEEITFQNLKSQVSLSGTFTFPKTGGMFPTVVLISGSGPQNRDGEIFGHKPFLVLSDYLTQNGIAVLRYDERGIGKSTGNYRAATSADFANDVESAIAYLKTRKEVDQLKIGLVGHSEGGMIAPMIASKTSEVSFIVLLAAPGLQGDKLLLQQQEAIAMAAKVPLEDIKSSLILNKKLFDKTKKSTNNELLRRELSAIIYDHLNKSAEGAEKAVPDAKEVNQLLEPLLAPWMQYYLKSDPALVLRKVNCSVLAINGDKDLQVLADDNLKVIEQSLKKAGNRKITILKLPGLNHLFQETENGSPTEYPKLEQTFSEVVMRKIVKWIGITVDVPK